MDRLGKITIHGFRSIRAIDDLELKPLTVLIGANGAGKSNIIEVFTLITNLRLGMLNDYAVRAGGADEVIHFGRAQTDRIRLQVQLANGRFGYLADLVPTANDGLGVLNQAIETTGVPGYPDGQGAVSSDGPEAAIRGEVSWSPVLEPLIGALFDGHRVYDPLDTSRVSPAKKRNWLQDNERLHSDGSNLASFLYLLAQRHPDHYQNIVSAVRRVAPFIADIRLEPLRLNPETNLLQWTHVDSARPFGPWTMSGGTLRFIMLATLFLQPVEYRPAIIIVDEPELGLHPHAIHLLAGIIQSASVDTAIVIATQSPQMVDPFQPEDILVTEREHDATVVRSLDREELDRWLQRYSLGELWQKNLLGGRPTPQ